MAKKQVKIPIKEKLHYKKPLKECSKAIDDIVRIRNNEQAKLRRLNAKFAALPTGKKAKGSKKQADALRKEIKALDRGVSGLKNTVSNIREACKVLDTGKGKIKSLKLKAAAIDRKLRKMPRKEVGGAEYKKLQNDYLKQYKVIKDLQATNTDILYRVNKGLGFDPEVIADRFKINKNYLEKHHKEDFNEEFFEEVVEVNEPGETEGGGGGAGGGFTEEVEEEEEEELEEGDYVDVMDEIFWQVSQNFTKIESYQLQKYTSVIIEYNGKTSKFAGTSISLIEMKFNEAVRWAETQPPYIMITKYVTLDQTKLKYIFYES